MGKILGAYLMPHPPIIVPEVGRGEEKRIQSTRKAMELCSQEIREKSPDTILLITPHGTVFEDAIAIMGEKKLKGNLSRFGASKVVNSFTNNLDLVQGIIDEAQKQKILCVKLDKKMTSEMPEYDLSTTLDWGALVPLYFVSRLYNDFHLVHISISMHPYDELYAFGTAIQRAVTSQKHNVVVIASGDLSHRLHPEGPYGFNPMGPKLDEEIMGDIRRGDVEGLVNMDRTLVEEGGECGLRSIIIALGTLDGYHLKTRVLSYEGPFGVGYGVAAIEGIKETPRRSLVENLRQHRYRAVQQIREREDPYVSLARQALEVYIKEGRIIKPDQSVPEEMLKERAGVFVSIKKHGQLRGCIGTIEASKGHIADEIIQNAIHAGTRDPRFMPVEENELKDLIYSVDILGQAEPIQSIKELDVKRYGVIVRKGRHSGLLLPNLEGINTPEEQVAIALQKAGISPEDHYSMERFEVVRHK